MDGTIDDNRRGGRTWDDTDGTADSERPSSANLEDSYNSPNVVGSAADMDGTITEEKLNEKEQQNEFSDVAEEQVYENENKIYDSHEEDPREEDYSDYSNGSLSEKTQSEGNVNETVSPKDSFKELREQEISHEKNNENNERSESDPLLDKETESKSEQELKSLPETNNESEVDLKSEPNKNVSKEEQHFESSSNIDRYSGLLVKLCCGFLFIVVVVNLVQDMMTTCRCLCS